MSPHLDVELPTSSSAEDAAPAQSPDKPVENEAETETMTQATSEALELSVRLTRTAISEYMGMWSRQMARMGHDEASVRGFEDVFLDGVMYSVDRDANKQVNDMTQKHERIREELRGIAELVRNAHFLVADGFLAGRICSLVRESDSLLEKWKKEHEEIRKRFRDMVEEVRENRRATSLQDEAAGRN